MERKRSEEEIENTNFPVRNTDLSSLKSNLEYSRLLKMKMFFMNVRTEPVNSESIQQLLLQLPILYKQGVIFYKLIFIPIYLISYIKILNK